MWERHLQLSQSLVTKGLIALRFALLTLVVLYVLEV